MGSSVLVCSKVFGLDSSHPTLMACLCLYSRQQAVSCHLLDYFDTVDVHCCVLVLMKVVSYWSRAQQRVHSLTRSLDYFTIIINEQLSTVQMQATCSLHIRTEIKAEVTRES